MQAVDIVLHVVHAMTCWVERMDMKSQTFKSLVSKVIRLPTNIGSVVSNGHTSLQSCKDLHFDNTTEYPPYSVARDRILVLTAHA
jgi:hypothetical protein